MTIQEIVKDKRCVPGAIIEACGLRMAITENMPSMPIRFYAREDWQFVSPPKSRRDEILELCGKMDNLSNKYGDGLRLVDLIRAELAESGEGPKFQCGDRVMVSADGHIGRVTMTSIVYKLDNRLGAWNEMELRRACRENGVEFRTNGK